MGLIIKILIQYVSIFFNGFTSCVICGKSAGIYHICKQCQGKYFSNDVIFKDSRCCSCGKILISTKEKCMECRENIVIPSVNNIFTVFPYRLWNKELMFFWKSTEIRSLSFFFARILHQVLENFNEKIIVPVPPRPGKINEKGWDQIDEICKILEQIYKYKILKILKRHSSNQQKKLGREDRINTIGKNYTFCNMQTIQKEIKKNKISFPEKVCLLDDVCTTGSTIESCSSVLKQIGVKEVSVVTLFKVD